MSYKNLHYNSEYNYLSYFCITPPRVPCFTVTAEAARKTKMCSADTQGSRPVQSGSGLGRCQRQDVRCFCQLCWKHVNLLSQLSMQTRQVLLSLETTGNNKVQEIDVRLSLVLIHDHQYMYCSHWWTFQLLSCSSNSIQEECLGQT